MDILPHVQNCDVRAVSDGQEVITEGSKPPCVYVLKSGAVSITHGGAEVHKLELPGTLLGEISAMLDCESTATVTAVGDTELYVIGDFARFLKEAPQAIHDITAVMTQRLTNTGHQGLATLAVNLESEDCPTRAYAAGDVICAEGLESTAMYVLKTGAVKVIAGGAEVCRVDAPGTTFGEVALFCGTKYSATVAATSDVEVFVISDLEAFFSSAASLQLTRSLAQRLTEVIAQFSEFKAEVMKSRSAQVAEPGLARKIYERWDAFMASDVIFTGKPDTASTDES
jgi:CRP-like cAMP-binding protein